MGKRKAAKKVQGPKKQEKLATVFDCLFCNHSKCVAGKIDKKENCAWLRCRVCSQEHRYEPINFLTQLVDVYSDWVDKCEEAKELDRREKEAQWEDDRSARPGERGAGAGRGGARAREPSRARGGQQRDEDEDEDAEGEDEDDVIGGRRRVLADDDDY